MRSKKLIVSSFLIIIVAILGFVSLHQKKPQINSSNGYSSYSGYLTKVGNDVIFRGCTGDTRYQTLIPTEKIDPKLTIEQPTFVSIRAKITNNISEVDEIHAAAEKKCDGNTDQTYLLNIFSALKDVSNNEALIEDGINFTSREEAGLDCPECLQYTYEFDHASEPNLHYKTVLLIKNGVVIKKNSNQ